MKIWKPYEKKPIGTTENGKKTQTEYQWKYNNNGTKELVKVGEKNIYDEIQTYKEDVDLVTIINRLGGIEQLQALPAKGVYQDLTQMPRNLYEAVELQEQAHKSFDKLPTQIKEAFNNDPLQFMAQIGTDKFKQVYEKFYKTTLEDSSTTNRPSEEENK